MPRKLFYIISVTSDILDSSIPNQSTKVPSNQGHIY